MCESDEEDFVSASEGEDDERPEVFKNDYAPPVEMTSEMESDVQEPSQQSEDNEEGGNNGDQEGSSRNVLDEVEYTGEDVFKSTKETTKSEKDKMDPQGAKAETPDACSLHIEDGVGVVRKESSTTSGDTRKEKKDWVKVDKSEESSWDEGKSGWDEWEDEPVPAPVRENNVQVKKVDKPNVEEGDGWNSWEGGEIVETAEAAREEESEEMKREQFLKRLSDATDKGEKAKGWGWGGVLSGIGESFSSAVESSLGLPSAHVLAQRHAQIEKIGKMSPESGIESAQSHTVTHPFADFGVISGLVNGGIDVLESIGKKTFETITVREEQAGRRRFIFEANKGENLSSVLRELREKNEAEAALLNIGPNASPNRLPDVASSFEKSDGIVHLEALELVATSRPKQKLCVHRRLQKLLDNERVDTLDTDVEFADELKKAIDKTGLPFSPDSIIVVDRELERRIRSGDGKTSEELFKEGVDALEKFTAASVHLVSKLASLLAVMGGSDFDPFVALYRLLSSRATQIANLYMLAISASDSGTSADELGTQIQVEASTVIDFIRQAHYLLINVIEVK